MEDNQTQEPQPQGGSNPPPSTRICVIPPFSCPNQQTSNSEDAQSRQTRQREPTPIIIEEDNRNDNNAIEANRIANRANRISWVNLILTIAVFVITYMLFYETQKSTKAAISIAEAAQNTYKEQRYNDSVWLYRDSVKNHDDKFNTLLLK